MAKSKRARVKCPVCGAIREGRMGQPDGEELCFLHAPARPQMVIAAKDAMSDEEYAAEQEAEFAAHPYEMRYDALNRTWYAVEI
ncbi:MAG: hypothetical protein HRF49_07705 [bacterium]